MKMKTPEMSVVRFDEEDILTASGDTTRWSLGSWRAINSDVVGDESSTKALPNFDYYGPIKDGNYNYLDGIGFSDENGNILTIGDFYHFDLNSFVGVDPSDETNMYWNWKTCTDESHHYLVDPGK